MIIISVIIIMNIIAIYTYGPDRLRESSIFLGQATRERLQKRWRKTTRKPQKNCVVEFKTCPGRASLKASLNSLSLPPLALAHALHLALHKLELFFLLETISGGLWAQKPTIASELQSPIPSRSPCMPAWFLVPAPSPSSSCNPKSLAERVRST